jgi:PBSX family phage terminase large subunit
MKIPEGLFSEKQLQSMRESNAPYNIWEGAVRSGKTHASLWRFAVGEVTDGPAGELGIITKTYDSFKRNIYPTLKDVLWGSAADYYIGKREVYLNDRLCHIITADDARAEGKLRGCTLAGCYIDEITIIPENVFMQAIARLSIDGSKLFGTTNPDSPYHWFKKWMDENDRAKVFKFTMDDNPALSEDKKAEFKRAFKGLWYQRFIEGKWVQAEGAVYDFFSEKLHVIDFAPPPSRTYICGIDYGWTNPTAFVLIGINPYGYPNYWVESEYYYNSAVHQRQKTDSEYAEDLINFIKGKSVQAIYMDPSAASFFSELRKMGVSNLYEAKNEVTDGIRFVGTKLNDGTFKICRSCKNLIAEFQSYVWDDKAKLRGKEEPKKENDHALDALRYALYSHFFNKEGNRLTPQELDRNYREALGQGDSLPHPFQAPNNGLYGGGFFGG